MYPLGTRTAALRPDPRNRPGEQPRRRPRALFAADPLAARIPVLLVHGLVDNRSVFSVMSRNLRRRGFAQVCTLELQPAADRRRPRRSRPRCAHRAHLRADRPRPGARRRPQPRRPDRPLLRAAAGRRSPGGVPGHPRDAAPGVGLGAHRAHAADPPATPGLGGAPGAGRAGPRAAAPRSPRLQRPRPDGRAHQFRALRPPRPADAQRAGARRRAHVPPPTPRRRGRGRGHAGRRTGATASASAEGSPSPEAPPPSESALARPVPAASVLPLTHPRHRPIRTAALDTGRRYLDAF